MKKEIKKQSKGKRTIKEVIVFSSLNLLVVMFVAGFSLLWQGRVDEKAFADGIWLVFAFQLTFSWSLFVYNQNIFTPLFHGFKTFLLLFAGRKPKDDYYTVYTKVKDNPIPYTYIYIGFVITIIILVIGVIFINGAYV
jgi:hypothetical protein